MKSIIMIAALCTALLSGCSDESKQMDVQGKGLRQYDRNVLARGDRLFQAHCAQCHGSNGEAKPDWRIRGTDGKLPPPPLDDNGHAWHHPRSWLKQMVAHGSPTGQGNMPAWQGKLSDQEIDEVVTWITSLWSDAVYLQWHTQVEHAR